MIHLKPTSEHFLKVNLIIDAKILHFNTFWYISKM